MTALHAGPVNAEVIAEHFRSLPFGKAYLAHPVLAVHRAHSVLRLFGASQLIVINHIEDQLLTEYGSVADIKFQVHRLWLINLVQS